MNRFRRITLATLAGGLAAGIGFKAFARGGGYEMHLDRMLKHLYVEIDATEEQKAKLEPIVRQAAKDLLPMRDSLRAGRGQAIELLTQERLDPQAIEALRAKQLQLADQASRRLTQAMADAAEVLTPAQRKELAAHVARRRWGHR
ncbi:MAG TPA: Spy/CpxP family protein refolding chaperone [Burkholderiales bacterium]|jgi:periplasmic protein CpxP/Spy|nr:Spy/CpxP family protein refolding chaperone [Burkholderiales bacterium]